MFNYARTRGWDLPSVSRTNNILRVHDTILKDAASLDPGGVGCSVFHTAEKGHMGLVPVYVRDECTGSRVNFVPGEMERDSTDGIGPSLRV